MFTLCGDSRFRFDVRDTLFVTGWRGGTGACSGGNGGVGGSGVGGDGGTDGSAAVAAVDQGRREGSAEIGIRAAETVAKIRGLMAEVAVAAAVRRICGQSDGGLVSSSSSSGPGSSVRARFEKMIRDAQDSVCEAIEAADGGSAADLRRTSGGGGSAADLVWRSVGVGALKEVVSYLKERRIQHIVLGKQLMVREEPKSDHDFPMPNPFFRIQHKEGISFEIMFLVNAAMHKGIINQHQLSEEFFTFLRSQSRELNVAALRHICSYKRPVFDCFRKLKTVLRLAA
ncbi:hypothetical protein Scep_026638 [Stephania cephalantha]|uniref:RDRP helical domain-containing protein n=1 Tax=Stephania cephalantha TaxID=152367 RepID=A0AAP0EUE7_9MAGN